MVRNDEGWNEATYAVYFVSGGDFRDNGFEDSVLPIENRDYLRAEKILREKGQIVLGEDADTDYGKRRLAIYGGSLVEIISPTGMLDSRGIGIHSSAPGELERVARNLGLPAPRLSKNPQSKYE